MAWAEQVKKLVLGAVFWLIASSACAELIVVVSRDSNVEKLSRHQVADIFLGRAVQLESGEKLVPVDLPEDSGVRKEFYEKLLGKSPAQMRAYWSKIIFTGRGLPPKEVNSTKKMKKEIAHNRHYVGYVAKKVKDSSLKAIFVIH